ncbi:hypothetical protein [Streptomyces sp. NPDC002537]
MDLDPDHSSAHSDQEAMRQRLLSTVEKAGLPGPPPELALPLHPAAVEVAHLAWCELRSGPPAPPRAKELARWLDDAAAARSTATGPAEWPVELAGPGQPHLSRALDRTSASPGAWRPADRAALASAVRLLGAVWPGMLGELRASVAQVALLDGAPADGRTGIAVHGAVLVDRRCFSPTPAGLLGSVRLAEALVHEGTLTRCAAAAAREPFATGTDPVAARQLDERVGRMVALSRCVLLYRRLLGSGPAAEPAVEQRHDRLLADLGEAVDTVGAHRAALTERGIRLLDRGVRLAGGIVP